MKQKCFVYITFNSSQLWVISVLDNQKALQNTFQTTTFNVEENSRTVLNTENSQAFPLQSPLLLCEKTGPK